jgi:2-oxoglutarate dehydrogenase E1 component
VAVEFLHIQNKPMRRWLIQQMESTRNRPSFGTEKKLIVLDDLIHAEEFEHFMHSAFIGQKRFSLEGAEVVIPALHHVVDSAPAMGIKELILGMTHRGRLTVLNRILGKPLDEVFAEFEGYEDPGDYGGSGDVRYHLGYQMDHTSPDGSTVRVNLVANPSHLESVGPVVQGMARAVQRERGDTDRRMVVPIVLHGDAAFSGQGVVAETFNLSTLKGYKTGGTLQQSDRFHHLFARRALHLLPHGRRQDAARAGLPRERGRPRGRGVHDGPRPALPPDLRQGRGGGHLLLPQVRP